VASGKQCEAHALCRSVCRSATNGMIDPRPPEPHTGQEHQPKRQLVGFSMASERRRRVPLPEMSGFAGRNGTKNGTT